MPIDHVIVLMLENRSYDFLFGYLANGGDGVLAGGYGNTWNNQSYPVSDGAVDPAPYSPGHQASDAQQQIYDGTDREGMNGFVANAAAHGQTLTVPLELAAPDLAPVMCTLATQFTCFDRWFCSVPGPTWPNRLFGHCATAFGTTSGQFGALPDPPPDFTTCTVQGLLAPDAWQVVSSPDQSEDDVYPCVLTYLSGVPAENFSTYDTLWKQLDEGEGLPSYTWVQPLITTVTGAPHDAGMGGNSMHATECIACGEAFVALLYNRLRKSRYWDTTLLLITFDEHGGFYDHVPPPSVTGTEGPELLGVRVPAVAVSPYAPKGVVHTTMEHSSIVKTVRERFRPGTEPLTPRDANATSILEFLTNEPRTDTPVVLAVPMPPTPCNCASSGDST